jgi:hypothetical protein
MKITDTFLYLIGPEDFVGDDLRPTAINNWRLQGHDYFRIIAASGHKTMNIFKRYNQGRKNDLQAFRDPKWIGLS